MNRHLGVGVKILDPNLKSTKLHLQNESATEGKSGLSSPYM